MSAPLNPWLAKKIKQIPLGPELLPLLVEVDSPDIINQVAEALAQISLPSNIPKLTVGRMSSRFIEITAPVEAIELIQAIPGVKSVNKNMVKTASLKNPFSYLPQFPKLLTGFKVQDPLEGEVGLSSVTLPRNKIGLKSLLPFSLDKLASVGPLGDVQEIPTSVSRNVLLDIPTDYDGTGVKIAILDTGSIPVHPQCWGVLGSSKCSTDPTPLDNLGHGGWVLTCATGRPATGILGKIQGVAPGATPMPIKVLNGVLGIGSSMDIILGIEKAVNSGAQIINLSLGGSECQGGCFTDGTIACPECSTVAQYSKQGVIFIIASGDSGPGEWTCDCPSCAPGAISVGSISITDYPQVSWFSGRGPSNIANQNGNYEPHPICAGPGGGRADGSVTPDEVIYSGMQGLMRGLYSGMPFDIAEGLHGTSQSAPAIAGLIAVLLQSGKIKNADDFIAVLQSRGHAWSPDDGYGVPKLSWF
jgi:hypothetical protein